MSFVSMICGPNRENVEFRWSKSDRMKRVLCNFVTLLVGGGSGRLLAAGGE